MSINTEASEIESDEVGSSRTMTLAIIEPSGFLSSEAAIWQIWRRPGER